MGIKEQMEVAEKLAAFEAESRRINDDIRSISEETRNLIKGFEENICNKIKNKILAQGKSNSFEITEKSNNWSMKYKSLEYNGHFTSAVKYVERTNGNAYSKVEFILELEKNRPNQNINLTGPYKNAIEQMEERVTKEKAILEEYKGFKETLKDTDITIKYQMGKRDIMMSASLSPRHKENFIPVNIEELVKIIIG
jgi:hypothetical protein